MVDRVYPFNVKPVLSPISYIFKSKINAGTTALERPVEQTTGWRGGGGGGGEFKALLQLANFTLGPDETLNTETHKNSVRIKAPN